MKQILCILFITLFFSCSNSGKKQRLAPKEIENQSFIEQKILIGTTVLDTIIPREGVKYKEVRFTNPLSLPIKLDFTRTDIPEKEFDLKDYCSSIQYITLKFPYPDKGGFLGESKISILYEQGSTSMRGYGADIRLLGDKIIAGDRYQGYYLYDKDGNYIRSLISPDNWHDYNARSNKLTIEQKSLNKDFGISTLGDNYLLSVKKDGKGTMYFGNAVKDEVYLQRPYYNGTGYLASNTSYLKYNYHPEYSRQILAQTLSLEDEILCKFSNNNPVLVKQENTGYYPQNKIIYDYDGVLTFRQQYNDTIFRLKSDHELEAAYILNFGDKRQGVQDGYVGRHDGKYAPDTWLETQNFVWFLFTEGRDTPAAREMGTVKFFYYFYDKKEKQLYKQPTSDFPETVLMKNTLENGLPMRGYFAISNGKTLYEGFTKNQLQLLIKHPVFNRFTLEEQERMKTHCEALGERDLLLILLTLNANN
ncbi:DUF4933 domain-containing protein [Bacteroidales bacterium OttesenSCG-928-M11]|nr:DUF4933 domain-containing protein [Bacteroidales bacterium OttesenSCG-928-M11]